MTRHRSEDERRAQILRAARAVFIDKGFEKARVQDVARRAGLSKGAVYFYFRSKRELFLTLVEEEHETTVSFLQQAAVDPRPATVKLLDLGRRYLDYFAGLKSPPRFFILMSEMAIRDDEIRGRLQQMHQRFIDELVAIIDQGQRSGEFGAVDPLAVAQLLKAFVDGLAGESAVGIRPDAQRLSTDGIRLIFEGLGLSGVPPTVPGDATTPGGAATPGDAGSDPIDATPVAAEAG